MKKLIIRQEAVISQELQGKLGRVSDQIWKVTLTDDDATGEPVVLNLEDMLGLIKISFRASLNFTNKLPPTIKTQVGLQMMKDIWKDMPLGIKAQVREMMKDVKEDKKDDYNT